MDAAGWSVLRTMVAEGCKPPAPRGGHTATLVDKNILIQGGQQHKSSGTFEYFSLNPVVLNTETHTWFEPRVSLGKGPQNRAYHTTTRIGGKLLVFGGSTSGFKKGGGPVLLGDMPVFDLVRMAWELRDVRGKQPRPRSMHTAALVAGKLFIVGGFDGVQSLGDLHVLDTETMLWSQPRCDGKVPPSLQAHACALVGDRLLLLGGCTVHLDDKGHTCVPLPRAHLFGSMSMFIFQCFLPLRATRNVTYARHRHTHVHHFHVHVHSIDNCNVNIMVHAACVQVLAIQPRDFLAAHGNYDVGKVAQTWTAACWTFFRSSSNR